MATKVDKLSVCRNDKVCGETFERKYYIDCPNKCMLLFHVIHCNNALLWSSIFTNKSSIGPLDIIDEFAW